MLRSHNRIKLISLALLLAVLVSAFPFTVLAASNPAGTGQPSQSCQAVGVTPGNAANAPGSAFNTSGKAGTVYAGTQPQNSNNTHSVSQYDVACFQVSHH